MISGLNQEVQILGKTFHFQTELSGKTGRCLRTEVFVGGKVVASREYEVEGEEGGDALRSHMKNHHMRMIRTFVARAKVYELRSPEAESSTMPEPEAILNPLAEEELASAAAPDLGGGPPAAPAASIGHAIRVRRFFGRVRKLVGPVDLLPGDLEDRLGKAVEAFDWMMGSALFLEIRIDEQARCSLLTDQIKEWMTGDKDQELATQIWSGIVIFSNYLAEINHRSDLIEFDRQLLTWALDQVRGQGMTDEVLKSVKSLYGRHPRFDRLLDDPEGISEGTWTAQLGGVLKLL